MARAAAQDHPPQPGRITSSWYLVNANNDGRSVNPIVLHDVVVRGSRLLLEAGATGACKRFNAPGRHADIHKATALEENFGGRRKDELPLRQARRARGFCVDGCSAKPSPMSSRLRRRQDSHHSTFCLAGGGTV